MGLRCLIGHEYGERQTSRDRTQRGSEVVVTVQEYRECSRCGHRRIISENKEVTAEPAGTAAEEPSAEAAWAPDEADREEDQSRVNAFARSSSADGTREEPLSAEEDDGIILEDEPETPPRGHGEWPEAEIGEDERDAESEPGPWPDEEAAPEPAEPEPPEPPADDPMDPDPAPGEKPATAGEARATEDASAEPVRSPTPRPDHRTTEFVCPDCGETWSTRNASLRPGDICPECRQGYLDERVVQ